MLDKSTPCPRERRPILTPPMAATLTWWCGLRESALRADQPRQPKFMGSISTMAELTAGQDGDSTATATETTDSDTDELPQVFDEIGADTDRVRAAREAYDDESFAGIVELAEAIRDDDEGTIAERAEAYRLSNGINRVLSKWGFDRGGDGVMDFRSNFYGASDGSDEGTHNYVQAQAREAGVNLPWYKVMFPEPRDEAPDSVLVTEGVEGFEEIGLPIDDGLQDSHIFVPAWYAQRYAGHVNDAGIPLPPSDGVEGSASQVDEYDSTESLQLPFDPSDMNVDELASEVSDIDDYDALVALHEHERGNKNRKTAIKRLNQRMAALDNAGEGRYGGSDDDSESDPVDALIEAKGLDEAEAGVLRALLN